MNIRPDFNLIEQVSRQLVELLGDDFDADTFWDTLEGETNVMEVCDHVLASMQSDEALSDAIAAQIAALSARKSRIDGRGGALKRTLLTILDATGQKKLERPLGTVSRRAGSVSVRIIDEAEVPSQLCTVKTITAPDKTAIRKQIEAGELVPGAELVRGADSASVRVK